MFGDLLVDTKVSATGYGYLCCILALPLPNFGLLLSTCLSCIWGFCFSIGECIDIVFLAPCTSGNFTPATFVLIASVPNIYLLDHLYSKFCAMLYTY